MFGWRCKETLRRLNFPHPCCSRSQPVTSNRSSPSMTTNHSSSWHWGTDVTFLEGIPACPVQGPPSSSCSGAAVPRPGAFPRRHFLGGTGGSRAFREWPGSSMEPSKSLGFRALGGRTPGPGGLRQLHALKRNYTNLNFNSCVCVIPLHVSS